MAGVVGRGLPSLVGRGLEGPAQGWKEAAMPAHEHRLGSCEVIASARLRGAQEDRV